MVIPSLPVARCVSREPTSTDAVPWRHVPAVASPVATSTGTLSSTSTLRCSSLRCAGATRPCPTLAVGDGHHHPAPKKRDTRHGRWLTARPPAPPPTR